MKLHWITGILIACFAMTGSIYADRFNREEIESLPRFNRTLDWFNRVHLSGFAAAGYGHTSNMAKFPHGSFFNKEATIFADTRISDRVSLFSELQIIRLGEDNSKFIRVGENFINFSNAFSFGEGNNVGFKIGRFDIPFGEEALYQDSIDNPLITFSAPFGYGRDEGILSYGNFGGLNWEASITDGNNMRSMDDGPAKAVNLKLSGNLTDSIYLSGSVMRNGKSMESAFQFGGSYIMPHPLSSSTMVNSVLYEADARIQITDDFLLKLMLGGATILDDDDIGDRNLCFYNVEPSLYLTDNFYVAGRVSGIGTSDSQEGYQFEGKPFALGDVPFGYDLHGLLRYGIGIGYWCNPNTVIKAEISQDRFMTIDGAPFGDETRTFGGVEVGVRF